MASMKPFHVVVGGNEGDFQEVKRHGYGELKWVDDIIYKGMWKNGKGQSAILMCILIFIFDQLILYWKFNKINFTWYILS